MENKQQSFNSEQSLRTSWYPVWIMRSRGKRRACQKLARWQIMKRIFPRVSRLYLALSTLAHFSSSTISSFQWQNWKRSINWESGNNAGKCFFQFWYEYLSCYNACAVAHSPEYCKIFDLLLNTPQQGFVKAIFLSQISESGKEVEKDKRCSFIKNTLRRNNFLCLNATTERNYCDTNTKFSLIDVLLVIL